MQEDTVVVIVVMMIVMVVMKVVVVEVVVEPLFKLKIQIKNHLQVTARLYIIKYTAL